MYAAVAVLHLW